MFPPEVPISEAATEAILTMCEVVKKRVNNVDDLKSLSWFKGVDWIHVR